MSYYTITVTSTKMWTSLHRLVLWAARCCSSPPRLKDSQCRGKNTWIKAFLLKYILIAGVNLHNKSQIIVITSYRSISPFILKPWSVSIKNCMLSKLVQSCKFVNHNSTFLKQTEAKLRSDSILYSYHKSKANVSAPCPQHTWCHFSVLSHSSCGHVCGHVCGRKGLACSFLPSKSIILNSNWITKK